MSGEGDRVTRDWDAETYDRVAEIQERWGLALMDRLTLEGDETVLDAGCGSGRVTEALLERVPRGKVIGVDASPSMIELARERLGDRVTLICSDLLDLELPEPVDAIFSNAAFHWVIDHERLFARLAAVVRSGGVLEAQFGGQDNVAELGRVLEALQGDERFSPYLRSTRLPWYFASLGDTEARLERAGFAVAKLWLEKRIERPREPRGFLIAVGLGWHLDRLPPELHDEFVDAVIGSMPRPLELEYVRLNVSAVRR